MADAIPQVTRIYQGQGLNSTHWQRYQPRQGDIIIATYPKSGTTLTQEIVRQLIFAGQAVPERDEVALWDISPWMDARWAPMDELLAKLEAQPHRRFIKSHIALDGLPYFPQAKYIVVGRDARDVAMSLWNHYASFTDTAYAIANYTPGLVGEPLPRSPENIHQFWQTWITRGLHPWESEGYPFWGNMHLVQSWWNYRHLDNILFVHYADLLANLAGEIQRIANFLDIAVDDEAIAAFLPALDIRVMREKEGRLNPGFQLLWKEGVQNFFFKGTNGRWQEVLTAEELALYEQAAAKLLTPDCRAWLEQGRVALTSPYVTSTQSTI
jgi:aryl sulfotransferase